MADTTSSTRAHAWLAALWRWLRGQREAAAASPRWIAAAGASLTSPRLAAGLLVLTALTALAPTAFSLATGTLIGALPGTVGEGMGSEEGRRLTLAVAAMGGLFVLQQVVGPLRGIVGDALGRRYLGWVRRRVMRASLRPATIRHLEEPALHDKIQQSHGEGMMGPSGAPPRLATWASERLRGTVALIVVGHFSVWLALLLVAVWLHHLRRSRAVHRGLITVRWRQTPGMRYGQYLGGLPLSADVAKEVRVFGLRAWLGDRFEGAWTAAMAELWTRRRDLVPQMALAVLPVVAVEALALALIGRAAVVGEVGVGALIVYANAVFESYWFGGASDSDLAVEYATAGLKPLAELERLVETDSTLALPGTRPADGLPREGIRFEGVSFSYPGQEEPVLRNLDLEIPAGRSLAIVGANGAGKTTLVKLLARLYDPSFPRDSARHPVPPAPAQPPGRMTIDGVDLREVDVRSWQRRVAAIFQDFVKYQLPAYDNVALGAPERQGERAMVALAARRAGALELIDQLPKGWDTILSRQYTGGVDLSGGQWQRVALARALFAASAGASVLIMDEPTAHLDVRAEAAFFDSFLDLTQGLTTILVSHRFSTVRRADRIVVLEGGRAAEDGSHEELMRLGGRYAYMFTLQAQRFEDDQSSTRTDGRPGTTSGLPPRGGSEHGAEATS